MPVGTKRDNKRDNKKEVEPHLEQARENAQPSPQKDTDAHSHHLVRVTICKESLNVNRATGSSSPHWAHTIWSATPARPRRSPTPPTWKH